MSYYSSHLRTISFNFFIHLLRQKQAALVEGRHSKCKGGDVRMFHFIGIDQVQTGPDPFRHVKLSRSATERNWDVTETFLSVWTSPFHYTWENFTERWCSATERKLDVECELAHICLSVRLSVHNLALAGKNFHEIRYLNEDFTKIIIQNSNFIATWQE